MKERIVPTHFIKSYSSILFDHVFNTEPSKISLLKPSLRLSDFLGNKVVAIFLIREKTPNLNK